MREIKFRAFHKEQKVMCEVISIGWIGDGSMGNILCHNIGHQHPSFYELMQFTGLHDKNGKEIWEGDIIKDRGMISSGDASKVVWSTPDASWCLDGNDGFMTLGKHRGPVEGVIPQYEVLGNIYENTELLK